MNENERRGGEDGGVVVVLGGDLRADLGTGCQKIYRVT